MLGERLRTSVDITTIWWESIRNRNLFLVSCLLRGEQPRWQPIVGWGEDAERGVQHQVQWMHHLMQCTLNNIGKSFTDCKHRAGRWWGSGLYSSTVSAVPGGPGTLTFSTGTGLTGRYEIWLWIIMAGRPTTLSSVFAHHYSRYSNRLSQNEICSLNSVTRLGSLKLFLIKLAPFGRDIFIFQWAAKRKFLSVKESLSLMG